MNSNIITGVKDKRVLSSPTRCDETKVKNHVFFNPMLEYRVSVQVYDERQERLTSPIVLIVTPNYNKAKNFFESLEWCNDNAVYRFYIFDGEHDITIAGC